MAAMRGIGANEELLRVTSSSVYGLTGKNWACNGQDRLRRSLLQSRQQPDSVYAYGRRRHPRVRYVAAISEDNASARGIRWVNQNQVGRVV